MLPLAAAVIVAGWLALVFAVGAAPLWPSPQPTVATATLKAAADATVHRIVNFATGVHS